MNLRRPTCIVTITLLCHLFFTSDAFSQRVVMDETVNDQIFSRKFGPNGTHYFWIFGRWAFPVSLRNEQSVKAIFSSDIIYGIHYKYRLNNFLSTGGDFALSTSWSRMQDVNRLNPYSLLSEWDKERIKSNSIMVAWYVRINAGRRGNHLGRYLDAGIYGGYNYFVSHIFSGMDAGKTKIVAMRTAPSYISKMPSWGICGGLGINHIRLTGQYRMSDFLIPGKVNGGDLPRLTLGLEYGFSIKP
jgi:hypothetical protein